jgi:hypothetical protein
MKKTQAQEAAEAALRRLERSLEEDQARWVAGWEAGLQWSASQASYQQLWRLSRIGESRFVNVRKDDIKFLCEVLNIAGDAALPEGLDKASSSSYVLGFVEGAQRVFNTVKGSLKPPKVPRRADESLASVPSPSE